MQIREFAALTGVSVRTLHYYDEIGLLKPCFVDEQNSYRFYDERSLVRMQEILFYRELDFPLKHIARILSSPDYEKQKALSEQKQLLILKKQRLERLIAALEDAEKGNDTMDQTIFDNSAYETARRQYAAEARQTWGHTAAYQECEKRTASYTPEQQRKADAGMDALLREFAQCTEAPSSPAAQALVQRWQDYISETYYPCTMEILAGLGELYVADERFQNTIDRYGAGTAVFLRDAIRAFCGR